MNHKHLLTLLALASVSAVSGRAQIFSENFGNLAPGTAISTGNTGFTLVRTLGEPSLVEAISSTVGTGSSLRIVSTVSNLSGSYVGVGVDDLAGGDVATLSFTVKSANWRTNHGLIIALGGSSTANGFYDASGNMSGSSPGTIYNESLFAVRLMGNSNAGSNPNSAALQLAGSSAWEVPASDSPGANVIANGVAVNFHFVINGGSSSLSVDDVVIDAGKVAVWLDGQYLASYDVPGNADATSLRIFAHGRGGSHTTTLDVEIDDLRIWNGAVAFGSQIPEPSSFAAVLGLGALAGVAFRRRRA